MDCFRSSLTCGGKDAVYCKLALAGWRRAYADCLIRFPDERHGGIHVRMHCDGTDAKFLSGAIDPTCDLAAIGNQE
jgi:hypothetical protein